MNLKLWAHAVEERPFRAARSASHESGFSPRGRSSLVGIQRFRLITLICFVIVSTAAFAASTDDLPRFRWENFSTANGLPDNHVFCVLVDGDRIWAGTENGLGLYENGAWKTLRPATSPDQQGIAHRAVLSLALDKRTGDLWVGTMGGLSRISAGRIDNYTQLNSGLSNDIVYVVGVQGDYVWTATAAGASRLNTRTGQWDLFNATNTPMYEIWTYAVAPAADKHGITNDLTKDELNDLIEYLRTL